MKVSLNGKIMDAGAASVPLGDRGFTLGDGLFETLGVHKGRILRLKGHIARLRASLAAIRLDLPLSDVDLVARLAEVVAANSLTEGSLRVTITRGSGPRGLLPPLEVIPTVLITASPWAPRPLELSCIIARSTSRNEHSPLSRIKSLAYLDNILALAEARDRNADDALILNTAGRIACASAANVFAMIDGELVTPPLADGLLPGTVRAEIIASHGGMERALWAADLSRASEIILSNSLGLRAVTGLDGRPVGSGAMGPVCRALLESIPFPGE